jgi:hypothetical protein
MYFDYDFVNKKQFPTSLIFPFVGWCAANIRLKLVEVALPQFKAGGITGSTKRV